MQEKTDIIIVGGGITGLCIAYLTAKAGKKVKVVEASKSFGGLLSTFEAGGRNRFTVLKEGIQQKMFNGRLLSNYRSLPIFR